jgi:hypothetical protein
MRPISIACCCLALLGGCSTPVPLPAPEGPGRFGHSVIYRTIAPWDGAAVQFSLSETPLVEKKTPGPHVSIRIYQSASELSKQRIRLEGKESRAGSAQWVQQGGQATPLSWAEIDFEEIQEGKPVRGTYDLTFSDGKRERGRFEAAWWKAEGPGG